MEVTPVAETDNYFFDGQVKTKPELYKKTENQYVISSTGGINIILLLEILEIPISSLTSEKRFSTEAEFLFHLWEKFLIYQKNCNKTIGIMESPSMTKISGIIPKDAVFYQNYPKNQFSK